MVYLRYASKKHRMECLKCRNEDQKESTNLEDAELLDMALAQVIELLDKEAVREWLVPRSTTTSK